jgi:tripartite-type tricarboxylate transporter receptor subunit TctC
LTLMVTTQSPIVVNPPLLKNPPYDPVRDLSPVALFARTGFVLVAAPSFPATTMAEAARVLRAAPPGTYSAANPGLGTMSHLAMALLGLSLGTRIESVPYRGSAPALNDTVSGTVQAMLDQLPSALGQIQGGRVRALAVTGPRRSALLPNVPTLAEIGLAEAQATSWGAVMAPAGTPAAVVERYNALLRDILADATVKQRLAAAGADAVYSTPGELAATMRSETQKWGRVVREARITVN